MEVLQTAALFWIMFFLGMMASTAISKPKTAVREMVVSSAMSATIFAMFMTLLFSL